MSSVKNPNEDLRKKLEKDIEEWEGQDLEFMENFPDNAHELAKEIAAFASSNPGTIYLGVDENKNICGVSQSIDDIKDRISGVTQNSVQPSLKVKVRGIKVDDDEVVRIDVPDGEEPQYYVRETPYIRNLTSSTHATPDQVKQKYKKYFSGTSEVKEGTQDFLFEVLFQLSDFQIAWFDHNDRKTGSDLRQLQYDIGTTSSSLLKLSRKKEAIEKDIDEDLKKLGNITEELANHNFYIDGGKSWDSFDKKGNEALELTERLMERVKKRIYIGEKRKIDLRNRIFQNIKELESLWERKDRLESKGKLEYLKASFRRLSYNFNRFANVPTWMNSFNHFSDLKEIARILRKVSSRKYFPETAGVNPLEKIEDKVEKCLNISESISAEMEIKK